MTAPIPPEEDESPRAADARPAQSTPTPGVSDAFSAFQSEAPGHAAAWMEAIRALDRASALDKKTEELAYLAVLAALRLESGVPFHVMGARRAGASKAEVISAILLGLPAAGNAVTQVLPAALRAYDTV
jgi:alkylhydroperoxidase/carboxymuconolactone decarboxylase family protein YurZ